MTLGEGKGRRREGKGDERRGDMGNERGGEGRVGEVRGKGEGEGAGWLREAKAGSGNMGLQ